MSDADRQVIRALASGRLPTEVPAGCELADDLRALVTLLTEAQQLAISLGRGELALPSEITSRGPIIGSLKGLHASLRHLTWQAQRIAEGDLSHQVDFMGEFADAFNTMVAQLAERRRLEEELRQSHKIEAVARLSTGLAHEINTPAQFTADSVNFVRDAIDAHQQVLAAYRAAVGELADDPAHAELVARLRAVEDEADIDYFVDEARPACDLALEGVERIATIVAAMKTFAQPDEQARAPADLNAALHATLTIARDRYDGVADVVTDFAELPEVTCRLAPLNEVFLALVTNAADAIADAVRGTARRGTITVRTRPAEGGVVVEIADDGCGIPDDVRDRIFDPFFTTKDVGSGTGQGLTVARLVVVDQHDGTLTFDTTPGEGTTFRIHLPLGEPSGVAAIAA